MIWVITLTILWVIGCICFLSLFVATKRADQRAEVMFSIGNSRNVQYLENEKEMIGNICLS